MYTVTDSLIQIILTCIHDIILLVGCNTFQCSAGNFNLQTARDYHEIAANVMYQDDEIMNTVQTTPFSDPAIIAKVS